MVQDEGGQFGDRFWLAAVVGVDGRYTRQQGRAIYNLGTLALQNVRLTDNSSDSGGTVAVQNSIVAFNDQQNCLGSITSLGNNLANDTACGFVAAGDWQNSDPLLAALGNYGGATQTRALLPGSPAIEAGDAAACPATDQRGVAWPQDGGNNGTAECDIGVFELDSQLLINDVTVADFWLRLIMLRLRPLPVRPRNPRLFSVNSRMIKNYRGVVLAEVTGRVSLGQFSIQV